jgi:phage I-like protein
MLSTIRNRYNQLPADHWYHIVPRGEFPHPASQLLQVIDDQAIDAIIANTALPILVDRDHFSYDPDKSSEAFGWIRELQNRDGQIWGRIDWTDLGLTAITNKQYRFVSPVWLPRDVDRLEDNRIRPRRLDSVGLTNSPNLRGMVPLTNRQAPADNHNPGTHPSHPSHQSQTPMKNLLQKLGLSPDASEQSAIEAVTALQNRVTTLEPLLNRVTELETQNAQLLDATVEQDLDKYANRFAADKRDAWKKSLLANRETALSLLESIIPPAPANPSAPSDPSDRPGRPLTNRAAAKTPDTTTPSTTADPAESARRLTSAIEDYRIANRCTYADARAAIRRKSPELFA